MTIRNEHAQPPIRLRCGVVLGVRSDDCDVFVDGQVTSVAFASVVPAPRPERISPGHLVAIAAWRDGSELVVWRWYDAVVLGQLDGMVRMWEPAHGEVRARPRNPELSRPPGTRAYLSAGLPGADWWVSGAVEVRPGEADVELPEVERFFTDAALWGRLAADRGA